MRTQRVVLLFTGIIFVLLMPRAAAACGCNPFQTTVLETYEAADLVVIARMLSVEKRIDPKPRFGGDVSGATMVVEKVYKGNVAVKDQLEFVQGDETLDCSWSFYPQQVSERYLLYLFKPRKPTDGWTIPTCYRSRQIEYAQDDLLYLNNMENHRGQTRVSGVVNSEHNLDMKGRKVRIIGRKKTYVTTTDEDGVYEIYGLPPGRYTIEPELPFGWKVDEFHLTREYTRVDMNRRPSNRASFTLQPRKHFGVEIELRLSNYVSGTIVDSRSKPLQWVCVSLVPVEDEGFIACNDLTDSQGRFRVNSVRAGTYFLILNYENKPTQEMPFPRLYYPGVVDRDKASTLSVKHGESVKGLQIVISDLVRQ